MIELFKKSVLYRLMFANESLLQFVKFCIVGVSNAVVALGVYYLFVFVNPELYLLGNFVGWLLSVLNAFYWANKVVFTAQKQDVKSLFARLTKCYLTYTFSLLLTQGLLYVEISILGLSEWIVPIANIIIATPINFLMNKFWAFREKKTDVEQ